MNTSQKSFLSIRSKLLAAVAMLLVASFMVVSSTYAWFTLSTAPEVTGITTQVGANGNLEIALNTTNTLPGNGTGLTNVVDKNATWGNIIDLGDAAYGLNTIVLKPSVLAVTKTGKVDETPLYTPVYGSDGRVSSVEKNGFYGTWNGNNGFTLQATGATEGYGVRALGTVSSMSAQELQYATSSSNVKTNLDLALTAASTSLRANGGELVTLILKGATNDNPEFDVTTNNEFAPLQAMISKLEEVPDYLEVVIQNFMLIALADAKSNETDTNFELMVSTFNDNWDTMFTQLKSGAAEVTFTVEGLGENGADLDVTFSVPEELQAVATTVAKIETAVGTAQGKYNEAIAVESGKATWDHLTAILAPLMDINKININGETYATIKEMQTAGDSLYSWAFGVAQEGVKIGMSEGSGVYADIASVTQNIGINFKADIDVSVDGKNLAIDNMNINMYTDLAAGKITNLGNYTAALKPDPKEGADANAVITDTYAYVLDFVFRTNAAGSTLKLQQAATDRIYGDNTDATSATMGGGSYMEFSTQAGFGDDSVKNLMDNIKLVFVDTKTGELLVGAYLDTATAESDGSTVKAAVKLQKIEAVADKEITGYEQKLGEDGQPMFEEDGVTPIYDLDKPIYRELETATLTWGEILGDQNIVDLGQNEATYISVYVYLDGTTITNADVAALSNLSTSGNLNLQFSSSAELKPMDYSGLQNPTT